MCIFITNTIYLLVNKYTIKSKGTSVQPLSVIIPIMLPRLTVCNYKHERRVNYSGFLPVRQTQRIVDRVGGDKLTSKSESVF